MVTLIPPRGLKRSLISEVLHALPLDSCGEGFIHGEKPASFMGMCPKWELHIGRLHIYLSQMININSNLLILSRLFICVFVSQGTYSVPGTLLTVVNNGE